MRSRTVVSPLLLSSILVLVASPAKAQDRDVDAERFKPAVTTDGWVNAEGSGVRGTSDPWEFGLFLNYGINPLVTVDEDDEIQDRLVGGRLGIDLLASVTLADPFAIGLGLPLFLFQSGDGDPSFAGLGDLRLVPKLRILDDRESVGLALAVELRAPTHSGDYSGGARNIVAIPKAILDHRFEGGLRLGVNAGVLIRERTELANINAGSEFVYAADIGYRFGDLEGDTEIGFELNGALGLSQTDREEAPLEGFLYIRHEPTEEWEIQAGPGIGIIPGYGVPVFRVFAGVRYRPTSHDADGDGIGDDDDQCPNEPEDKDHYQDADGCPEEDPDEDQDGVPDKEDDCPGVKETINGVDDDDGCPDTGDPRVIYEEGQIKILENVQFEHGSAEIKEESHGLLDQVALTMKANPNVKKVRVEGHTDDTGPRDVNVKLSKRRAESVKAYLVKKGVNKKRLETEGFGPDKPLIDEKTPEARAKNRRVEFVVEED